LLTKGACVKERLAPACRADGFQKEDSWQVPWKNHDLRFRKPSPGTLEGAARAPGMGDN
jgi:hypothetical protein